MNDTVDRLRILMAGFVDLPVDEVPASDVLTTLGVDSVTGMDFLVQVEKEFGVLIDDRDLSPRLIDDLGALAAYIEARVVT